MRRRAWLLAPAVVLLVAALVVGEAVADELGDDHPAASRSPVHTPAATVTPGRGRRIVLGDSLRGRQIVADGIGSLSSERPALVVGCIHGNEPAGIAVARDLVEDPPPAGASLWVIPNLNPDGVAAHARGNARGVDLNRNFPWHWRQLGGQFYSGPSALSEPESRAAQRFIVQRRPRITIWFHQHDDVVDESGGDVSIERRFARLAHMPLARLPRYPGSATGWENHAMPGTTAFVVELPAGRLSPAGVERFSDAILRLIRP